MLAWLLLGAGLLQVGICGIALTIPRVLRMREHLRSVPPFTAAVARVHAAFIAFTIAGFALVTLLHAAELASGGPLARTLCLFLASFWTVRLFVQIAIFRSHPYRANRLLALGFHGLSLAFALLAAVYAAAAIR